MYGETKIVREKWLQDRHSYCTNKLNVGNFKKKIDVFNTPKPPGVRCVLRDGAAGGRVSPTFGEHRRDTEDRVF
jgi:hypothetical protein